MGNSGHIGGLAAVLLIAAVIATVVNAGILDSFDIGSLDSLCDNTDYQDICHTTIGKAANSSSPSELMRVAFQVASDEVEQARAYVQELSQSARDEFNKNAFEDCRTLLVDAGEELEASLLQAHDLEGLAARTDDIKVWLSAVITYQQTCLDGVTQEDLREKMDTGLRKVAQVTSNAIAFMNQLDDLMKTLDIQSTGRRLMSAEDRKYPSWMPLSDRKLLQSQSNGTTTPNVVVALDGSGDFKSINDALKAMPKRSPNRYIIYVKAGVYKEKVNVTKDMTQVFMYGDGPRQTIVTGSLNCIDYNFGTMHTASFAVEGQGFIAKLMGFSNTAGPEKHQAVALRVKADMAAFFNCRMDAYQDTLYVHAHRQFYRSCTVSGTVDFIFGDSSTVMQNCLIIVRRPMDNQKNTVTAHGRAESKSVTGLVLQNCKIVPDKKLDPDRLTIKSYLGRPWKRYARTVIMESMIGDVIDPEGWMPWQGESFEKTCYYAEYNNHGPGAGTSGRVKWPGFHVINKQTAEQFTAERFLGGTEWIGYTGITYFKGFKDV